METKETKKYYSVALLFERFENEAKTISADVYYAENEEQALAKAIEEYWDDDCMLSLKLVSEVDMACANEVFANQLTAAKLAIDSNKNKVIKHWKDRYEIEDKKYKEVIETIAKLLDGYSIFNAKKRCHSIYDFLLSISKKELLNKFKAKLLE